jgi:integrase
MSAPRGSCRFHQGAWRIAVRAGRHEDGGKARWVRATVNAPNTKAGERIARRELARCVAEADRLRAIDAPGHVDLLTAIDRYVDQCVTIGGKKDTPISPNTLRHYRGSRAAVAGHPIGVRRVRYLTAAHVTGFYNSVRKGSGNATCRQVHILVHAALELAVANGWCDANPSHYARRPPKPKARKGHVRRLTPALVGQVLGYVAQTDPYYYTWLRMSSVTGARPATLAGMRWRDLDLDAGLVHFERSVVRGTLDNPTEGYTVKGLKTDEPYKVALDAGTVAALRAHRRWLVEHFGGNVATVAADRWVFPRPSRPKSIGDPVSGAAMSQRWRRLRAAYGEDGGQLDGLRLYDLRHYVATQMFAAGDDPLTVAARLGHSDPATTMREYAEFLPGKDRAAADRLAADIDGAGAATTG